MNSVKFHNHNLSFENVYLPDIDNICSNDDVEIYACLSCGQFQGKWPVDDDNEYIKNHKDLYCSDSSSKTYKIDYSLFTCNDSLEEIARHLYFEDKYDEYIKHYSRNEALQKAKQDFKKEIQSK